MSEEPTKRPQMFRPGMAQPVCLPAWLARRSELSPGAKLCWAIIADAIETLVQAAEQRKDKTPIEAVTMPWEQVAADMGATVDQAREWAMELVVNHMLDAAFKERSLVVLEHQVRSDWLKEAVYPPMPDHVWEAFQKREQQLKERGARRQAKKSQKAVVS